MRQGWIFGLAFVAAFAGCSSDESEGSAGDAGPAGGGTGATGVGGVGGVGGSFGATGGVGASGGAGTGGTGIGGVGDGGTPGQGKLCYDIGDCPTTAPFVCRPGGYCNLADCSPTESCPIHETCVIQLESAGIGACYPNCVPVTSPCGGGYTCKPNLSGTSGYCLAHGNGSAGKSCAPTVLSTTCTTGLLCIDDGGEKVCRDPCVYWASGESGCPSGERCSMAGACAKSGSSVAIGEACASGDVAGQPCGADSAAWRGLCRDLGTGLVCARTCRMGTPTDCPPGKACYPIPATPEVGVCN